MVVESFRDGRATPRKQKLATDRRKQKGTSVYLPSRWSTFRPFQLPDLAWRSCLFIAGLLLVKQRAAQLSPFLQHSVHLHTAYVC